MSSEHSFTPACFQRPGDQREHTDGQIGSGRHQILKNGKTTGIDAIHAEMLKDVLHLIESVQSKATKIVKEIKYLEYSERLKILDLTTLEQRDNVGT